MYEYEYKGLSFDVDLEEETVAIYNAEGNEVENIDISDIQTEAERKVYNRVRRLINKSGASRLQKKAHRWWEND